MRSEQTKKGLGRGATLHCLLLFSAPQTRRPWYWQTHGQLELEFGNVGFWGEGKTSRTQQETQPTYDAGTGNRARVTLVGGDCSRRCTWSSSLPYWRIASSIIQKPGLWVDLKLLRALRQNPPSRSHFPLRSIPIMMPTLQANLCSLQVLLKSLRYVLHTGL